MSLVYNVPETLSDSLTKLIELRDSMSYGLKKGDLTPEYEERYSQSVKHLNKTIHGLLCTLEAYSNTPPATL